MTANGFKCGDYPKGPFNVTRHCCYDPCTPAALGGRTVPDPHPCTPDCDGYVCDTHFAEIRRLPAYRDPKPSGYTASGYTARSPRCAFCGDTVPRPKRGATRRFCNPTCKAGFDKARPAAK